MGVPADWAGGVIKITRGADTNYFRRLPKLRNCDMIKTKDNRKLRSKMLEVCMEIQQSLLDDFNKRIVALLESNSQGNEEAYDNQVRAEQTQRSEEISGLLQTRNLASQEMNELVRLSRTEHADYSRVESGAVVVTDRNTIFVSVSIEQFEVDGEPLVGVSTSSPLYQAMKGLKKGDTFQCMGIDYKITDIF
jgi:hypothetical protein